MERRLFTSRGGGRCVFLFVFNGLSWCHAEAPTKKKRRAKDQFAKDAVEIDLQRRLAALQCVTFSSYKIRLES